MLIVYLEDRVDKQKLSLQKEFNKACAKDAKLQAEELALIERTSCLNKQPCAFLSYELCLRKQLGVLSEKKKKMFARELASIKNLERSEQGTSGGVRPSDAVKTSELIVNSFDGLFDSFSPLILAAFVDIPQSSGPPLG